MNIGRGLLDCGWWARSRGSHLSGLTASILAGRSVGTNLGTDDPASSRKGAWGTECRTHRCARAWRDGSVGGGRLQTKDAAID